MAFGKPNWLEFVGLNLCSWNNQDTVEPRYFERAYFELPLISKWKYDPRLTWNYDNR